MTVYQGVTCQNRPAFARTDAPTAHGREVFLPPRGVRGQNPRSVVEHAGSGDLRSCLVVEKITGDHGVWFTFFPVGLWVGPRVRGGSWAP